MTDRVYLDACAVQRPLDRLSTTALRLEAAALEVLIDAVVNQRLGLVWSPALEYECVFARHLCAQSMLLRFACSPASINH